VKAIRLIPNRRNSPRREVVDRGNLLILHPSCAELLARKTLKSGLGAGTVQSPCSLIRTNVEPTLT
jgi:hypothetical protein